MFSEILNEERKYWIYVPETKAGEKGKAYPVLYLLDGDSFFHSVVGFTRFFSSSKTSNLPPCIVVAVLNTDRTRDFTPTCSAARRDGTICPYDLQQAAKNVYQKDFSGKHLYVAFATRQRPAIKLIQFSLADSLKNKIIPEMKNKHLHVVYKKFPDEVHGTIALPAIFDGLKSLFHNTISTKEAT